MPMFEYQCQGCKNEFERLVFAGDKDKVDCPECGSSNVRKKMSATSFMSSSSSGRCATSPPGGFS